MTDPVVLLSTGDVVGPNTSTNGTMVLFDGTSGKKIKGNNAVVTAQGLALLDDVDPAANRATIGLDQVNNTSDLNKPISTATQAALNNKFDKTGGAISGNTSVAGNLSAQEISGTWISGDSAYLQSIEVRAIGGTPHIDFSSDASVDFDARIALESDDLLNIVGVGYNGVRIESATVWNAGNFSPTSKANAATTLGGYGITDAYTIAQTNQQLSTRLVGDNSTYVGFASGDKALPYIRHTDATTVLLQPQLGYTPVEQGGGIGQIPNKIRYGWDNQGRGLRAQVDSSDMGLQWGERNFYQPNSNNFSAVAVSGTSVTLPSGGTWCYSLMHYFSGGAGVVGKGGQAAGGTVISFSGGATIYGFAWRYSS